LTIVVLTEIGVIQNYYRKSMQNGCILGKIRFATLQYSQKNYSIALRYYMEVLYDPYFEFLSNQYKRIVYNDISLCFYYKDEQKFWKYNKKARELGMSVAKNNAANAYFKGYYKPKNYRKALKLYTEALSDNNFFDDDHWTASRVALLKEMGF
jgi:TPR repeat protein